MSNNNNNNNNNNNKCKDLPTTFYKYVGTNGSSIDKIDMNNPVTKRFVFIWRGMKTRCYYKNSHMYKYYGERGIKIDQEWHDVKNFLRWCKLTYPKDGGRYSIDRIDVNKNYNSKNCRWATPKEQANNRRNNVVYKGKTLSQWADALGCRENTINRRLHVMNWSLEKAVTTPVKRKKLGKRKE